MGGIAHRHTGSIPTVSNGRLCPRYVAEVEHSGRTVGVGSGTGQETTFAAVLQGDDVADCVT
jgi:hypothetical protein